MSFGLALLAGIVPMMIYPLFLYWMDRFEKEPLGLLAAVFLWGFFPAALFSLISQVILGAPFYLADVGGKAVDVISSSIFAPITEEIFKSLAVLAVYLFWRNEFDGVFDGILYGSLVGFGFAAIENVLYFLDADASTVLLRGVIFGLNHAFFTSLTGIGFGIARHSPRRIVRFAAPLLGLLAAMLAHSIHNTSLEMVDFTPAVLCLTFVADWGGVALVFITMVVAIRRERKWIVTQLSDEVSEGTLNAEQYAITVSPSRRFAILLNAMLSGGPATWWKVARYLDMLTELAYKKHAFTRRGEAGASSEAIKALRTQAAALSLELADL